MDVLCFILLLYCALPAAEGLEETSVNVIPLSVVLAESVLILLSLADVFCGG